MECYFCRYKFLCVYSIAINQVLSLSFPALSSTKQIKGPFYQLTKVADYSSSMWKLQQSNCVLID